MAVGVAFGVLGPRLDGGVEHRLLRPGGRRIDDLAQAIEHEGHRAGVPHVAAVLAEQRPDIGGGAVAVVRQHLDDEADPARTEALVADFLIGVGVAALGLLDRPVDIVLGHGLGLGVGDGQAQARIGGGVGKTLLGGQGDVPR